MPPAIVSIWCFSGVGPLRSNTFTPARAVRSSKDTVLGAVADSSSHASVTRSPHVAAMGSARGPHGLRCLAFGPVSTFIDRLALLDQGFRIDERPDQRTGQIDGRKRVKKNVPVPSSGGQNVAADHRRSETREVPDHVHRTGHRAGVFSADVHASGPGRRHYQI